MKLRLEFVERRCLVSDLKYKSTSGVVGLQFYQLSVLYLVFWFFLAISITWNVIEYCAYFLNIWRSVSKDFRQFFTFLLFLTMLLVFLWKVVCSKCSSQIGNIDSKGKKQKKKQKNKNKTKKKRKKMFPPGIELLTIRSTA